MRPWAEKVYGIPPEQVVGSSVKTKFEMRDGKPVLVRLPELNFNDDKGDKPVGINQHIGRRPIMAFGNSNGDKQMLEYTQGGSGARFMLLVLHDDAAREFAYGPALGLPDVKLGAFTQALYDQAKKDAWTVVSMKNDWKQVFAFEQSRGHGHRHPAGAGRHDAPACRSRQRPPAQGLPERFRPGCDAPSAHHADSAFRPHRGSRQGLCRRRQGARQRQCDRHEVGGLQTTTTSRTRTLASRALSRSRPRNCSSCNRT